MMQRIRSYWTPPIKEDPPLKIHERIWLAIKEYLVSTQINGLFYISERRTLLEKIFWIAMFIISLVIGILLFVASWRRFQARPVLVTYGTAETPVYKIPFPALTICHEDMISNNFRYSEMRDMLDNNASLLDHKTLTELQYLQYYCDRDTNISGPDYFGDDFYDVISKIAPPFNESAILCHFMRQDYNSCSDIFIPTITEQGICHTFNLLSREELFRDKLYYPSQFFESSYRTNNNWDISGGYSTSDLSVYPQRALDSGAKNILRILLISYRDDYDGRCRRSPDQGFRAHLHSPVSMPRLSNVYFRIPQDAQVTAIIKPTLEITSKGVSKFSAAKRKCYFQDEKSLSYFQIYSKANCVLECFSNWTLNECGCVEFFMPRSKDLKICGVEKLDCTVAAKKLMKEMEMAHRMDSAEEFHHCDCLPLCNSLKYDKTASYATWDREGFVDQNKEKYPFLNQSDGLHISELILYMEREQFLAVERHELFSFADFVANFGGLLGLLTGISFLSFFELLYFCTLRLFYNVRLYGKFEGGAAGPLD